METGSEQALQDIAERLVTHARQAGAEACDVVAVSGQSLSCEVLKGETEALERSEGRDFGLRVFCGQSQAIVSTSATNDGDLTALAERAVAMARLAPADPYSTLVPETLLARNWPDLDLADDLFPQAEDLLCDARACEEAGLDVRGISKSSGASASASRTRILLMTSHGFCGSYERTGYGVSATMIAGDGTAMERDYDYSSSVHRSDMETPTGVGRSAGVRAVKRLNPRKITSQRVPVIYDNRQSGGLVRHLTGAINGSSIARGTSFLKDRMGDALFKSGITITDNPRLERGLASKPFDGEGVATSARALIENGHLQSWVLDTRSARQLGLETTGHASRSTGGPPSPATSNVTMAPGMHTLNELMREAGSGILVTELIGMGVNGTTGDYSRGASGFWFENGEIAYPVSEITLAGNLKDMFASLTPADDIEYKSAVAAPSCLIAEMTVAGI